MVHPSPAELKTAIRAGWTLWTSDPAEQPTWSADNPAAGQCALTALIVHDLLGGELLVADVVGAAGEPRGFHYWNRLAGGRELDLTREQFRSGQRVGAPEVVTRPADVTRGRLPGNYHLLAARVERALARGADGEDAADRDRPLTVKGVCVRADGRVLLCRNHRDEWELPGGRPRRGEVYGDTVHREIREETGIEVAADHVLGVSPFEVLPGRWVDVLGYVCRPPADTDAAPAVSEEHAQVAWLELGALGALDALDALDDVTLPDVYRELIERAVADRSQPAPRSSAMSSAFASGPPR